jgi:hypothetical protein
VEKRAILSPRCLHKRKIPFLNPLNAELNAICHLLVLVGDHHILHVSRVKVKIFDYENVFYTTQTEVSDVFPDMVTFLTNITVF